jgi:hypothetical protein
MGSISSTTSSATPYRPAATAGNPSLNQPSGQGAGSSLKASIDRFVPQNMGGLVNAGTMIGRVANAANTATKGGAEALPQVQGFVTALKGFDLTGLWTAAQGLGKTALSWGGKSAGIQGALSLVANGYRAITGQESWGDAGTNVVMDTTSGAVGGAAGAIAGGIGTMALTALGVAGGPLTIGAALIGLGGYFLAENLFKRTGIYCKIEQTVSDVMHSAFKPFSNG